VSNLCLSVSAYSTRQAKVRKQIPERAVDQDALRRTRQITVGVFIAKPALNLPVGRRFPLHRGIGADNLFVERRGIQVNIAHQWPLTPHRVRELRECSLAASFPC